MSYNKQMDDAGYELYITDFKMKILDDYTFAEKAEFEKEALGVNLLYNPMMAYKDVIKAQNLKGLSALESNQVIDALAIIKKIKEIKTKQGKLMAFVELDDGKIQIEATIFTETYLKYQSVLSNDIFIFRIKENTYKNQKTYVIESLKPVK